LLQTFDLQELRQHWTPELKCQTRLTELRLFQLKKLKHCLNQSRFNQIREMQLQSTTNVQDLFWF